jgi:hypothetical protein
MEPAIMAASNQSSSLAEGLDSYSYSYSSKSKSKSKNRRESGKMLPHWQAGCLASTSSRNDYSWSF